MEGEACLILVDGLVVGMLLGGESDPDDDLLLLRQILHILLHPAQQDWPQRLLQLKPQASSGTAHFFDKTLA